MIHVTLNKHVVLCWQRQHI